MFSYPLRIFGPPFVKQFALCYQTVVLPVCLSVCNLGVLWPNGWMDHIKLCTQIGLGRDHIVLDGDPAPLSQRGTADSPQFSAHICCGQMAGWIKVPLGMEIGLGSCDLVSDGNPARPPQKGGGAPKFLAYVVAIQLDASRWH